MALSSRVKNKIVDVINTTFSSIGHANGMRMPKNEDNRAPLVWEYHIAKHVLRRAERWRKEAEAALVKAGILPDAETNPQAPGKYGNIYNDGVVSIDMEVRSPSNRVDTDKLVSYLSSKGVDGKLLYDAVEQATTIGRGAHVFTPNFVVEYDFNSK